MAIKVMTIDTHKMMQHHNKGSKESKGLERVEESVEEGEPETERRIGKVKVVKNNNTKTMHTRTDKDNVTSHQPTLFDWVTNIRGSIDPILVQWVDHTLHSASIISTVPSANKFLPSTKGCSERLSKSPLPLVSPIDLEPSLPKPKPMPGTSTNPSSNAPDEFPGIKAEHKCGSPAAHYRYTRGFSHGYGNLRIRVTCHHRSTRIWVLVLGLRVLAKSTCETRVLFLFYLPILLLLCYIF